MRLPLRQSSLTAIKLIVLAVIAVFLIGCAAKVQTTPLISNSDTQKPLAAKSAPLPTTDTIAADPHYIQPDDFFYMEEPCGNSVWESIYLGKMTIAPDPDTNEQAQFFNVASGLSEWARYWVKTRPATAADMQLGTEIIFFDFVGENGLFRAPLSNQEARSGNWVISRITDTTELNKGYVMIGGGSLISERNIRVIK